jgi:hypothetical protein
MEVPMKAGLLRTLLLLATIMALGTSTRSVIAAQTAAPALRFVTTPGYATSVAGTGWLPRSLVVFNVRAQTMAVGIALRANGHGSFKVGLNGLTMCAEPVFLARDLRGKSAKLRGPGLGCPLPKVVATPQLRVLSGRLVRPRVITLRELRPQSVNVPLGDELLIAEPGQGMAFIPKANVRYLVPLQLSPEPSSALSGNSRAFLAVHEGHTTLDMSPACRQSTPACEIADFLIRVNILPPVGG